LSESAIALLPFEGFGSEFIAASRSGRLLSCTKGESPPAFEPWAVIESGQKALVMIGRARSETPARVAVKAIRYAFRFLAPTEESEGLLRCDIGEGRVIQTIFRIQKWLT
jgi:hypothetical protein